MNLDKLGAKPIQKEGTLSSDRVHDSTAIYLLSQIFNEMKHMRLILEEMSNSEIGEDDVRD